MSDSPNIFAHYAPLYRGQGFSPRPTVEGEKRPVMKAWERPDSEIGASIVASWDKKYADHGIGLVLGSLFADGSRLGALDIDDDRFIQLAKAALFDPVCGRIGARGIVYFVRVTAEKANRNSRSSSKARW